MRHTKNQGHIQQAGFRPKEWCRGVGVSHAWFYLELKRDPVLRANTV
jgi:hypothetical protein